MLGLRAICASRALFVLTGLLASSWLPAQVSAQDGKLAVLLPLRILAERGVSFEQEKELNLALAAGLDQRPDLALRPFPATGTRDLLDDKNCMPIQARCLADIARSQGASHLLLVRITTHSGKGETRFQAETWVVEAASGKDWKKKGEPLPLHYLKVGLGELVMTHLDPWIRVPAGQARLVVRADGRDGQVTVSGNGNQFREIGETPMILDVPPGTYQVTGYNSPLVVSPGQVRVVKVPTQAIAVRSEVPKTGVGHKARARQVPEPERGQADGGAPVYKKWWLWTIVGAVVVGGATTAGVLLGRKGSADGGARVSITTDPDSFQRSGVSRSDGGAP
jgi:hypothetical protein